MSSICFRGGRVRSYIGRKAFLREDGGVRDCLSVIEGLFFVARLNFCFFFCSRRSERWWVGSIRLDGVGGSDFGFVKKIIGYIRKIIF